MPRGIRARWTITDIMALWARRQAGEATADLAAEWGVTYSVLTRAWNKHGLHSRRYKTPPDSYWRKLRVRMEAGEPIRTICARAGVTRDALKYHWKRLGLTRAALGRPRKNRFKLMMRVWDLRRAGVLWLDVVEAIGWTGLLTTLKSAFHSWRERAGLPMVGPPVVVRRAANRAGVPTCRPARRK